MNRGNPFYRKSAWSCKFVQPGTVQEQKSIEGRSVVENGVRPGTVQERKTIASRSVRENAVRPGTVQERKSITNRSVSGNSVRPGTVQERESIASRSVSGNPVQPGTVQERKSITSRSVSGNSVRPGTVREHKNTTSRFPKENGVQPGAVQERKSIESRYVNENSVRPGTVQERNSSSRRSINNKTSIHIVRERSSIRPAQCGGEHHSADVVEGGPEWKGAPRGQDNRDRGNRTLVRDNAGDVGREDHIRQKEPLEEISEVGAGKESANRPQLGSSVCDGYRGVTTGPPDIYKDAVRGDGKNGHAKRPIAEPSCSFKGSRGSNTNTAGCTDDQKRPARVGSSTEGLQNLVGSTGSMEDCVEMGRGSSTDTQPVYTRDRRRDHNRLVYHPKREEGEPFLAKSMGGDSGITDGRNLRVVAGNGPLRKFTPVGHVKPGERIQKGPQHEAVHGTLHKERCDQPLDAGLGRGSSYPRRAHKQISKAQNNITSFRRNPEVWRGSSRNGKGTEDTDCYLPPLERDVIRKIGAGFTHRSKSTRIPTTAEEIASPLHVASTETMDLEMVQDRMHPAILERFKHVLSLTFPVLKERTNRVRRKKSRFSSEHAEELVNCGIAVPVSTAPLSENIPFTVYEERETGNRQRFILWTREANENLTDFGYEPNVPLKHISYYLDAVRSEVASCRDFKTGFFQIQIPEQSQKFFTFFDSSGRTFALTRLPMGHVCAPEIMNTIAAVVAGDPMFVREEFAEKHVGIHWWIDNIRLFGKKEDVEAATRRMDGFAKEARVTWKPSDTVNLSQDYEFLGVSFSHCDEVVSLGSKIKRKISTCVLSGLSASQLESLGGRLLHASAIVGVSPGKYWFALKYMRRITNRLNYGSIQVQDHVTIPLSVKKELSSWIQAVQRTRKILPERKSGRTAEVFVDASLKGWGGVIVWNSGELDIVGSSWPQGEDRHINVLEADALGQTLKAIKAADHLTIWVDNTTVCGVFRKKMSVKSFILNKCLVKAIDFLFLLKCSYTLGWVSTKYNPADIPSRETVSHSTKGKVKQALGDFFNMRRGGGAESNENGLQLPRRSEPP